MADMNKNIQECINASFTFANCFCALPLWRMKIISRLLGLSCAQKLVTLLTKVAYLRIVALETSPDAKESEE